MVCQVVICDMEKNEGVGNAGGGASQFCIRRPGKALLRCRGGGKEAKPATGVLEEKRYREREQQVQSPKVLLQPSACLVQYRKSTGCRRRAVTRTRSCGTSSALTRTLVFMQVTREALEGSEQTDRTGFVF